jgi:hypothetical protein
MKHCIGRENLPLSAHARDTSPVRGRPHLLTLISASMA